MLPIPIAKTDTKDIAQIVAHQPSPTDRNHLGLHNGLHLGREWFTAGGVTADDRAAALQKAQFQRRLGALFGSPQEGVSRSLRLAQRATARALRVDRECDERAGNLSKREWEWKSAQWSRRNAQPNMQGERVSWFLSDFHRKTYIKTGKISKFMQKKKNDILLGFFACFYNFHTSFEITGKNSSVKRGPVK